ncbi:MAG: peptide-methionine (S)-S-oxide reductase MsrA [Salinisphaeraceae bacterium]
MTLTLTAAVTVLPACAESTSGNETEPAAAATNGTNEAAASDDLATAVFAGGCFWCVEQAFDEVEGVVETTSGYTGGDVANPSYEQVTYNDTGHLEAVQVRYDPSVVTYETLLESFWHNIDPTDDRGQFCDKGHSYLSAIFVVDDEQRRLAQASRQALKDDAEAPSPIVTPIREARTFYAAEDYHQNYYEKKPVRYNFYKNACGRTDRLKELWGDAAGKP